MKPITEEQRQELIEFILAAQDSMSGNDPVNTERFDTEKLTGDVFEIALASLTAEPMYWEISGCIFSTEAEALKPGFRGTPEPIYEHPPVTVIKFPGISELIHAGDAMPAVRDLKVWELALSEIKRLNGLGD